MSIQRYELLRGSFENWLRLVVATLIIVISNIFILCHEYFNGDIAECTTLKQRDGILEAGQLSSQNAYYCRWTAELWKKSPRNIIFRLEVASNIKPYSENQLATLTLIFCHKLFPAFFCFWIWILFAVKGVFCVPMVSANFKLTTADLTHGQDCAEWALEH